MKYVVLMALFAVAACGKEAEQSAKSGNFVIEKLFDTPSGCTMYRTQDSRYIYWVECPHGETHASWREYHSNGKSSYTVLRNVSVAKP